MSEETSTPTEQSAPTEGAVQTPPTEQVTTPVESNTTPAEQVAPAEPEKKDDITLENIDIPDSGNGWVDSVLRDAHSKGIDVQAVFGEYSETGDPETIDREALVEKYGELATEGIISKLIAQVTEANQAATEAQEHIYSEAGGREMWEATVAWLQTEEAGLSQEGRKAYNEMLKAGGVQATLATRELVMQYKNSPGFTQPLENELSGDGVTPPPNFEPIGALEYSQEFGKIARQYGENSPQAEALNRRREISRSKGIM